jgi:hypothetical protein
MPEPGATGNRSIISVTRDSKGRALSRHRIGCKPSRPSPQSAVSLRKKWRCQVLNFATRTKPIALQMPQDVFLLHALGRCDRPQNCVQGSDAQRGMIGNGNSMLPWIAGFENDMAPSWFTRR